MTSSDYKPLLLVLAGPTASGKTSLAARIFIKYPVNIISADSRQIYRYLDIGTGKDLSFPQQMIDVVDPPYYENNQKNSLYTASVFAREAERCIRVAIDNHRVPVLVGGTGFYLESILFEKAFNDTPPHHDLRNAFQGLNNKELLSRIKASDPETYRRIDHNNRYRLIRAYEILLLTGSKIQPINKSIRTDYRVKIFVIDLPRDMLYQKIDQRVEERIKEGMIDEVRGLLQSGVSRDWLINLGLEYRWVTFYLLGRMTKDSMIDRLKSNIHDYSKRQISFFKRWENVVSGNPDRIQELIEQEISTEYFRANGDDGAAGAV